MGILLALNVYENKIKGTEDLFFFFLLVTFENDRNLFWVYHFENKIFLEKIRTRGTNFTSCPGHLTPTLRPLMHLKHHTPPIVHRDFKIAHPFYYLQLCTIGHSNPVYNRWHNYIHMIVVDWCTIGSSIKVDCTHQYLKKNEHGKVKITFFSVFVCQQN